MNEFDTFICHETTTSHQYAIHLKHALYTKLETKINAFIAPEDIPSGFEDEFNYRTEEIKKCKDFIIIVTNAAFNSTAIKQELEIALNENKKILICLDNDVAVERFEEKFNLIKSHQRLPIFEQKEDLAKHVIDYYSEQLLRNRSNDSLGRESAASNSDRLCVEPHWSISKINNSQHHGHLSFKLLNNTSGKLIIHGYRIIRITPEFERDIYYYNKYCNADEYKYWGSDDHFRIILWKSDMHVFHWNDVDIRNVYGINYKGEWESEVQVAYFEENNKELLVSIGKTKIVHE